MGLLSFLGKKSEPYRKTVVRPKTVYRGRAIIYNDSKTGRGEDKVAVWFPDSKGHMRSTGAKMEALGISNAQLKACAVVAYNPNVERTQQFCVTDFASYRNFYAMMNGRYDAGLLRGLKKRYEFADRSIILETALGMRRLPTNKAYAVPATQVRGVPSIWRRLTQKKR